MSMHSGKAVSGGVSKAIIFDTTMAVNAGSCAVEVKDLIGDCGC